MSQVLVSRGDGAELGRRGQNAQLRGHWAMIKWRALKDVNEEVRASAAQLLLTLGFSIPIEWAPRERKMARGKGL